MFSPWYLGRKMGIHFEVEHQPLFFALLLLPTQKLIRAAMSFGRRRSEELRDIDYQCVFPLRHVATEQLTLCMPDSHHPLYSPYLAP